MSTGRTLLHQMARHSVLSLQADRYSWILTRNKACPDQRPCTPRRRQKEGGSHQKLGIGFPAQGHQGPVRKARQPLQGFVRPAQEAVDHRTVRI